SPAIASHQRGQGARAARGRGGSFRAARRDPSPRGAARRMSELKRLVGAGLLIIAAGAVGLGGWTVLAPLSGAIVAPAFVKVDLNRKVVQHQEGGIVREIRVRDGDTVKQGQTLVVLEDVKVDSTLDLLSIQLLAERAKAARLGAEAAYAPKVAFPADILRQERESRVA